MSKKESLTGWWHNSAHAVGLLILDQGNNIVVGALVLYEGAGNPVFLPFSGNITAPSLVLNHTKVSAWPPKGPYKKEPTHEDVGTISLHPIGKGLSIVVEVMSKLNREMKPSPLPPPGHKEAFSLELEKLVGG